MSKRKRVILVLCILACVLIALIGGSTLAKYQSKITGNGVADIARWDFNVGGNETEMQKISLTDSCDESTLVNGKIAPGTKGAFDIVINATNSEVGVLYDVKFENEENKPSNLKFTYNDVQYTSIEELEEVLTGQIDANDENKTRTLTVNWEWSYESGSDDNEKSANDIKDTNEAKANLDYTFDVIVTGTQINPR